TACTTDLHPFPTRRSSDLASRACSGWCEPGLDVFPSRTGVGGLANKVEEKAAVVSRGLELGYRKACGTIYRRRREDFFPLPAAFFRAGFLLAALRAGFFLAAFFFAAFFRGAAFLAAFRGGLRAGFPPPPPPPPDGVGAGGVTGSAGASPPGTSASSSSSSSS